MRKYMFRRRKKTNEINERMREEDKI